MSDVCSGNSDSIFKFVIFVPILVKLGFGTVLVSEMPVGVLLVDGRTLRNCP